MIFSTKMLVALFALHAIGWLLSFIGLCAAATRTASHSWWIVVYNGGVVAILGGVVWKKAYAMIAPLMLSLLAISIVYTTEEVAYYMEHDHQDTFYVTGAGGVIYIITNFMWLVVFGLPQSDKLTLLQNSSSAKRDEEAAIDNDDAPSKIEASADAVDLENTVFVSPHAEFKIPVVALHAYGANPDDPNELSFEKGEILYIHEKKGSWWQAKNAKGMFGMVPCNFFENLPTQNDAA
ncbi:hypothetical protein BC940DRAFT_295466 [Gongronella butleri]|nr:hypothetical protein BC940DRAFT_295466 [Gongronella butleri]